MRYSMLIFALAGMLYPAEFSQAQDRALREACDSQPSVSCYLDLATAISQGIKEKQRSSVDQSIAVMRAQRGHFEQAFTIANGILDDSTRNETLLSISEKQHKHGFIKAAQKTIKMIQKEAIVNGSDDLLINVARTLVLIKELDSALLVIKSINDSSKYDEAFFAIAVNLATFGDGKSAYATAQKIENKETRAMAMASIAEKLSQLGQIDAAYEGVNAAQAWDSESLSVAAMNVAINAKRFDTALALARERPNATLRIRTLGMIAYRQAEAGKNEDARATLDDALAQARKTSQPWRDNLLGGIAGGYVRAGLADTASSILQDIKDRTARASTLGLFARANLDAGQIDEAHANLDQAAREAQGLGTGFMEVFVVHQIIMQQIRAGKVGAASKLVEKFSANPYEMARGYVLIAEKLDQYSN